MNVIDGQAGLIIYTSLIFDSLTIDNILNIVVLLILASVSIAMLTGENGILTKATTAKENTQRAEVIERAQIDIVAAQAENESGDITKAQLKTILDKYFADAPETLPDDLSTLTLTTKAEYGNYSIKASEIYNGTLTSGGITYTAYSVGDTFTVGGETFYVIEKSDANTEIVKGLAAKNIGVDSSNTATYLKQSDSAGTIRFSNTNYWSSETIYPVNLNNYESASIVSTDAIEYAKAYGATKGATGRLMKVEEVFAITGLTSSGKINSPNWIKTTDYWLGSAYNAFFVWYVDDGCLDYDFYFASDYGVRPVIEISKSSIQ